MYSTVEMPRKPFQRKEYQIIYADHTFVYPFCNLDKAGADEIATQLNAGLTIEQIIAGDERTDAIMGAWLDGEGAV